jgi:hypothetical protein
MPQDALRRLTWRQIVVLYRRGWEAEEMRGSVRETGRVRLYAPHEGHEHAQDERSPEPVEVDLPDVNAIERELGRQIIRRRR